MSAIVVLVLRIVLVIALYGFLVWALVMLWRDLRAHSQMISAPNIPPITITPLQGQEGLRGFSGPEAIIGRSTSCDLCFPDDTVSARHARLSYHHSQWWLEDLKSTNGTYLNDERVSMPTVIVSGDELRCGQVPAQIEIG